MSAAIVSRSGLPLSQVSALASSSRFCSMRSAILLRMLERSVGEVLPQAVLAAWAASSARSMSSAVDRRDVLEILALGRRPPLAADVVAVALLEVDGVAKAAGFEHVHVVSPV